MYCTQCGRKLAEDGTPCVCGSGQHELVTTPAAEPIPVPMPEPVPEAAEPAAEAEEEPVAEPVEEAPAELEAVAAEPEATEAEPEAFPDEPIPEAEEPAAELIEVEEEPVTETAAEPPVSSYDQPENLYVQHPAVQGNPYAQQSPYGQPAPVYAPPAYAVQQPTAVHTAIRSIAVSPLFMIATILMSAHFLLTIINSFIPTDITAIINSFMPLMQMIDPSISYGDFMYEITEALYQMQVFIGIVNLGNMILPALVLVGLWLTFVSAKKKEIPSANGMMILQIVKIISLVGAILSAVLVLIIGIVAVGTLAALANEMSSYSYYSSSEASMVSGIMVLVVILLIVLLAVMAVSIIYAVKVVTSITSARKALKTGTVEKTASMLVAVFCFISAGVTVLDMFSSIALGGWMNLPLGLCSAGANVLFALCIMQYNKAVKPLIAPKVQPVQQMPVPPQYPPYNG